MDTIGSSVDRDAAEPIPGIAPTPLGPDSLVWKHFSDWAGLLVAVWAGSMQNMHPQLGAGVEEHSRFFEERWERVMRSTYAIGGVVFDGPYAARTAARIRGYHESIKGIDKHGRPYSALNPETFFWAHATFILSVVLTCEHFGRPLTLVEKEQVYAEGVQWYRLYGISLRPVPPDWAAFCEYYDYMCAEVLEDNAATRGVLDMRDVPRPPALYWLPEVVWRGIRTPLTSLILWLTVGMYPPVVRQRLGLRWTSGDQRRFRLATRSFATVWRFAPDRLRRHARARAAELRESGAVPADTQPLETPDRYLPPRSWLSSGRHYLGAHEADEQDGDPQKADPGVVAPRFAPK